ncbi:GTP cyclohydrolase 1 type 2/Nif3 [Trichophaea hybrida]|nr:GTP cyclohydrolase 1 type 2/Nif3 [Trichophaea hybrida]
MATTLRSPVVRTVVNAIQRLYPYALADKSWDNTGLLLESPHRPDLSSSRPKHVVLLTIDLTRSVVDEAIALRSSMIITYHPIIFRPIKSLSLGDTQQESLLRLAQEGISVYSPHTAVDATIGGVNDWLADGISGGSEHEESRMVIEEVQRPPEGFEDSGMGRVVVFKEPVELKVLVERVKKYLGMERVMVADGSKGRKVRRIALCAGSGGSLFKNLEVDLFFTGELSHHEALAAKEKGISVISCFHTNTERGFLSAVMKPKLSDVLAEEWKKVTESESEGKQGFEVVVSKNDRDPYDIV